MNTKLAYATIYSIKRPSKNVHDMKWILFANEKDHKMVRICHMCFVENEEDI